MKFSLLTQNIFQDLENKNTETIIKNAMLAAKEKDSLSCLHLNFLYKAFPKNLKNRLNLLNPKG